MAKLIAKTPGAGLLPQQVGPLALTEVAPDRMTLLAPLRDQRAAVAEQLQDATGLDWPQPGRMTTAGEARALWFGAGKVLVIGAVPATTGAAQSDQTDAWAVMRLSGPGAEAVLSRLCPVDMRATAFPPGSVARSLLRQIAGAVARVGPDTFDLFVPRSMTRSAIRDFVGAMRSSAAQPSR